MNEKKDYKDTLNMPQTNFEMQAGLTRKEAQFRQRWLDNKLYHKILAKNKNNKQFVVHDGPPYANGSIHIGHALNKILKDIVVRFKSLQGFYSPFVPGWDTHGLPIENKMLSELKVNHKQIEVVKLRKEAAKYALNQMLIQKEQFLKLQMLSDFEEIYLTLDKNFEAKQLKLFKKMFFDGLIYKGLKPVYWSPSSMSALAEAEVEYYDHVSPSIYTCFTITKGNEFVEVDDELLIWTTTPWTLIANSGVAVGLDIEYSKVKFNKKNYIVASDLLEKVMEIFGVQKYKVVDTFKGKNLLGVEYQRPIKTDLFGIVVAGYHVSIDAGTGLVHMAPLFGEDDFIIGQENELDQIMHINDDGSINSEGDEFQGLFYSSANIKIKEFLEKNDKVMFFEYFTHSYPHDWRTKKPIIFRGTPQWFVSIDKIKPAILKEIEKIEGRPSWAVKRLATMIENRKTWTISRQRSWGVPIPIFYNEKNEIVNDEKVFDHVIELVEKYGSDVWFEKSVDELLPSEYKNKNWTKETNIMDVWFDSGSTSIGVEIEGVSVPFDLYLEGIDQYRGWFNSSIINSVAYWGQSPYRLLLSHGFVLDGKGKKMSKQLGNVVDPQEIIQKYGADILRLWVANCEYAHDVSVSESIIKQTVENYRKIRNTIKFLLGNLQDYDHSKFNLKLEGIHELINEKLKKVKFDILQAYNDYDFNDVIKTLTNFLTDLSSFYLSISKDSLYADKINSKERRMIQYNMYNILEATLVVIAPIMPTTAEDAYDNFNKQDKQESVHLEKMFEATIVDDKLEKTWKEFFDLKDEVYKEIEVEIANKKIKRTNDAHVTINTKSNFLMSLDLKKLLMIGKISFGSSLRVETFDSHKCPRCWNHIEKTEVVEDLCQRCYQTINS
ncbi:isoleucine--tRNA ligase [Mycoplasmopsis pulmonis]|uniref:isoleucine--tRNA ligase n=1 Tax=Mycoplasmopsis pulmonis TaxID=2107 RepID=UPI002ACDFB55|nr:isoleucine--tRNA ligase [Mycoplasmopsis pulmonis]MDZ7293687.1 isoleucine--tRNA ligase [Mycoplasmopsis pulmonis]